MTRRKTIKRITWILILLTAISGTYYLYDSRTKTATTYDTVAVKRENVIQTVSETGTIKSDSEVNLGFQNSGKLKVLNAKVGSVVKKGQVLAELDYSEIVIKKNEASASLQIANQELQKLLAGAKNVDINVAKAGAAQARTAYEGAKKDYDKTRAADNEAVRQAEKSYSDLVSKTPSDATALEQAIITAENNLKNAQRIYNSSLENSIESAVVLLEDKLVVFNNALDVITRTLEDEDGKDLIGVKETTLVAQTEQAQLDAKKFLATANVSLASAKKSGGSGEADKALTDGTSAANAAQRTLQLCFSALVNSVVSSDFSQAKLDGLKSGITAQQTLVSAAQTALKSSSQALDRAQLDYDTNISNAENSLSQAKASYNDAVRAASNALASAKASRDRNLASAQSRIDSAYDAWQVAEAQLNKALAPADKNDIALAQTRVKQVQASIDSVNRQIENSIIKSPIDGTVTRIESEIGEQVSPNVPAIYVLGGKDYKIEVLVPESDIEKVSVGNKTEITLDAFGDDVKFPGSIAFIDPAETVVQGVIYYKVTGVFDPGDKTVKPGMTANVSIVTAERPGVLTVPVRAVIDKGGGLRIVRVLVGQAVEERPVSLGVRGDEGMVEVVSGVEENENVIIKVITK